MGKTRVTGASTGGKESTGDKAMAARAAQGKPGEEEALQKPEVGFQEGERWGQQFECSNERSTLECTLDLCRVWRLGSQPSFNSCSSTEYRFQLIKE